MSRKTKQDWIMGGVEILGDKGAQALTVQALLDQLKVTKGSFYHHFNGIDDYIEQFLIFFEQEGTLQIIDQVEQEPSPQKRLNKLIEISTSYPPHLEVAMRAWALQDGRVRSVFERVDEQRIGYVQQLWQEILGDEAQALLLARMMYTILIGSDHILPPLSPEDTRAVFGEYLSRFGVDPKAL